MYMFGYAPEPLEVPLLAVLTRQHTLEWKRLLERQAQSRQALQTQHARQQADASESGGAFACLLARQQTQRLALEQQRQHEQEVVRTSQATEKRIFLSDRQAWAREKADKQLG